MGDRPASRLYDLQNLPEDPIIRPMLIVHGVPRHLWPDGFISEAQARALIECFGNEQAPVRNHPESKGSEVPPRPPPPELLRAKPLDDWYARDEPGHELCLVVADEPGCELNIGRLVAVVGEEGECRDLMWWSPVVPMDGRPWVVTGNGAAPKMTTALPVWVRCKHLMSTRRFIPPEGAPATGTSCT